MKLYRYQREGEDLKLYSFDMLKETPCGYWIMYKGKKKWTSKTAKGRFAWPCLEEAMIEFISRTMKYKRHLESQLKMMETIIIQAKLECSMLRDKLAA